MTNTFNIKEKLSKDTLNQEPEKKDIQIKHLEIDDLPQMSLEEEKVPETVNSFQIGELVHLKNQDPYNDKIYQVVDMVENNQNKTFRYRLSSGEDIENKLWKETDLKHADVLHLLDRFNYTQYKINLFVIYYQKYKSKILDFEIFFYL